MGWKRKTMFRLSQGLQRAQRGLARTTSSTVSTVFKTGRNAIGRFVDELVYAIAPEMGLRRRAMRMIGEASEARLRAFSDDRSGDDNSDRLHGAQRWMGSRLSADSDLEQSIDDLRRRSLELYRSTTAGGAIDSRVDHVVGAGFSVQAKIAAGAGISEEAAQGWNDQLETVYNRWSQKCDLTGQESLWQCSRLVERCVAAYGESFTVMWIKQRPGQPIPLVLEVVDPERISTPPGKAGDPLCRMGVQYNLDGEIIGYWLQTTHPYDTVQVSQQWRMIPASQMLHVYEKWFPGQSRGYAWMCRTLDRWRDGEDLDEAGIIAAQVEACHAAFVTTKAPLKGAKGMATGQTQSGNRVENMVPGQIRYESDAEQIHFANPTKSNIVGTLHEWNHRRIASGMNWPYEFLMKDWRGVSFAGGRLILNGAKITCKVEQQLLTVAWFVCVWNELVRLAVLFSQISGVEINISKFQQRPWIYQAHQWTAPAWSYAINPGEEVNADIDAVENNFKTLEQVCGERGVNLEDVLKQRQKERALERELEIEPPERMKASASQQNQAQQESTSNAN